MTLARTRDTECGRAASALAAPLIRGAEGCKLTAYEDPDDGWTIGWGHLLTPPDADHSGLTCTQEEADAWFAEDLGEAWAAVEDLVDVELEAPQLAALLSLIYNIGYGQFEQSDMRQYINEPSLFSAACEFPKWRRDDGIVMGGLVRRRDDECLLFIQPFGESDRERVLRENQRWKRANPG